jgi:hypothetical protein
MSDTIDLIAALQAEWVRAGRRSWKLLELAMHPPKAALGATPKAETDRRDAPVHRLVSLTGPIDFSQGGLFAQRLAFGHFDGDRVSDTFGTIPPEFFQVAFGWFGGTAGGPGPSSGDGG